MAALYLDEPTGLISRKTRPNPGFVGETLPAQAVVLWEVSSLQTLPSWPRMFYDFLEVPVAIIGSYLMQ